MSLDRLYIQCMRCRDSVLVQKYWSPGQWGGGARGWGDYMRPEAIGEFLQHHLLSCHSGEIMEADHDGFFGDTLDGQEFFKFVSEGEMYEAKAEVRQRKESP